MFQKLLIGILLCCPFNGFAAGNEEVLPMESITRSLVVGETLEGFDGLQLEFIHAGDLKIKRVTLKSYQKDKLTPIKSDHVPGFPFPDNILRVYDFYFLPALGYPDLFGLTFVPKNKGYFYEIYLEIRGIAEYYDGTTGYTEEYALHSWVCRPIGGQPAQLWLTEPLRGHVVLMDREINPSDCESQFWGIELSEPELPAESAIVPSDQR